MPFDVAHATVSPPIAAADSDSVSVTVFEPELPSATLAPAIDTAGFGGGAVNCASFVRMR